MIRQNKRLILILAIITSILLIPFIAMQFSNDVDWSPFDFLIMGSLLLNAGLVCELFFVKVKQRKHRLIFCGVVLFLLFLLWAELAVGIFGTPVAGS